jgi:hypothetical protein
MGRSHKWHFHGFMEYTRYPDANVVRHFDRSFLWEDLANRLQMTAAVARCRYILDLGGVGVKVRR